MFHTVAGIGELLWDVFPEGKRIGGAPMNFAFHCRQLGANSYPVSCIGTDPLGLEIRQALNSLQVDHFYVADVSNFPTGTVQVELDSGGHPTYTICEGVAWDVIPMTETLAALAQKSDAVCFGSLCQRSEISRSTICTFLDQMRPDTIKIFDVNLRQSFYTKDIIVSSLERSTILKISDDELPVLSDMFGLSGSFQDQLCELMARYDLQFLAFTRGKNGSLLLAREETSDHPGYPAQVIDSVGAGDSFTAALCVGLLNGRSLSEINDHANRVAAYVCSQMGATPELPSDLCNR